MHPSALASRGCLHWPAVAPAVVVANLRLHDKADGQPGQRYACNSLVVVEALRVMQPIATLCCPAAKPVRAVMFDKAADNNWSVPWHQDRTIAVKHRVERDGFGPWSVKDGIPHVEPPFAILSRMVTLRLHLDDCPGDNSPLHVAIGSHQRRVAAEEAAEVASGCETVLCTAAAGDIWAYATPILHRSKRATLPSRRRVLQIDFSPDDLPSDMEWLS